jgi:high affinity Mn2+ porin
MRSLLAILSKFDVVRRRTAVSRAACFAGACFAFLCCDEKAVQAADLSGVLPTKAPPQSSTSTAYDWSGFYVGMQAGYAWGSSNWTVPGSSSGSLNLAQPIDTFNEAGSWFLGLQAGYDYMLPNRFVIGGVVDASFPSFQTLAGISIGDISPAFASPNGPETYSETILDFGTVRGRIGYAPGNWLFYATGGLAWAYDRLTLTQLNSGTTDMPFLWRFGWAAGAGVEVPVAPHWTASLEYLFTDYGNSSGLFANAAQRFTSDFTLQELRAGLNYRFGEVGTSGGVTTPQTPDPDILNFHGQATFTWQGYPAFRSPYQGTNSLPGSGLGRETADAILYVGVRLWQGAELWIDPEVDQGHGLAETHGVAGFTSGEAYKLGFSYPYARANRYFVRQTIDLGGDSEKVEADANQFAGSQTADRLVLWAGKFYILDVFDTNKYANNPKSDFLNWSVINNGAFDFGGDAWSDSYGAAAEWYRGNWAFRAGIFDMSQTPAGGGGDSALAYGLDPTFRQFELIGEIEDRYTLWGQPGKIKLTGFLIRGDAGNYDNAIALSQATGLDVSDALAAVRTYQSRPGVLLNVEQQLTETVGLFARAGWADGNVEPWDNTDIDRSVSAGLSFSGKTWNRPDDTIGIAGVINGISSAHIAYFNAGGLGIVIGDGMLPHPGLEQIIETYYSYSVSSSTKISFDYQFINNPAYNTDRGPVNVFAGRVHWQF